MNIIGYRIGDHVYDPTDVTVLVRTDWPGLGDEAAVIPVPVLESLAGAWTSRTRTTCPRLSLTAPACCGKPSPTEVRDEA